jgi:hypothetical protein
MSLLRIYHHCASPADLPCGSDRHQYVVSPSFLFKLLNFRGLILPPRIVPRRLGKRNVWGTFPATCPAVICARLSYWTSEASPHHRVTKKIALNPTGNRSIEGCGFEIPRVVCCVLCVVCCVLCVVCCVLCVVCCVLCVVCCVLCVASCELRVYYFVENPMNKATSVWPAAPC